VGGNIKIKVSVSRETARQLERRADEIGTSPSGIVAELINAFLQVANADALGKDEAPPGQGRGKSERMMPGGSRERERGT
jgi:hypothetical protein